MLKAVAGIVRVTKFVDTFPWGVTAKAWLLRTALVEAFDIVTVIVPPTVPILKTLTAICRLFPGVIRGVAPGAAFVIPEPAMLLAQ